MIDVLILEIYINGWDLKAIFMIKYKWASYILFIWDQHISMSWAIKIYSSYMLSVST